MKKELWMYLLFYKFRTKVECGGQCMIEPTCSAFRFEDNSCQLYDANYLYKDKTDNPGMTVYMHDNLWSGRGNTIVRKFKISSNTLSYKRSNDTT